jgi:hypothetical protein
VHRTALPLMVCVAALESCSAFVLRPGQVATKVALIVRLALNVLVMLYPIAGEMKHL